MFSLSIYRYNNLSIYLCVFVSYRIFIYLLFDLAVEQRHVHRPAKQFTTLLFQSNHEEIILGNLLQSLIRLVQYSGGHYGLTFQIFFSLNPLGKIVTSTHILHYFSLILIGGNCYVDRILPYLSFEFNREI